MATVHIAAWAEMTFVPKLHTEAEERAFFGGVVETLETWVVEAAGEVAGFAALSADMLEHLYVHPRAQGGGIGTALLALAKERRPVGFSLWVFQPNTGARRFYERHGLELVELTDGRGNQEQVPDARYVWRPR